MYPPKIARNNTATSNGILSVNDRMSPMDTTESEIQSVREKIHLLEIRKLRLQNELDKLDVELTGLRSREAHLIGLRNREASLTAPIWRLPNEVLSHIFVVGLSTEDEVGGLRQKEEQEEGEEGIPEQPDFAILVSHVSHHFREVAIKTPALWSRIHVYDLHERRLCYIETCLQRSGSLLYSLCLDCEGDENDDYLSDTVAIDRVMLLVKANIDRLERFMAKFRFFNSLHSIMSHLTKPAPQLTTLELYDVDYEQDFEEDTPFTPINLRPPLVLFDGQMPKLSKLMLDSVHVAWSGCHFKNLTTLELGYHPLDVRPTYQEFQAIMKDSSTLRELSLQGSAPLLSDDIAISRHYTPFVLDSLERLRISDISSDYASTLVSLFRAPNLKTLILSELDTNDFSPMFDRIAGPPALFPNLTALKLISIEANNDSVAGLLRAYPKLEWLGLYAFRNCPQWVSLLERHIGEDPSTMGPTEHLCPNLKTLRCIEISLMDIQTMIMRRMNANLPLPILELHRDEESRFSTTYGLYTSPLIWLKEHVDVEFIEPSDYDSDEDSDDNSDWVSEESGPYSDVSALDYELDAEFGGYAFDDESEDVDDDDDDEEEEEEEEEDDDDNDDYHD